MLLAMDRQSRVLISLSRILNQSRLSKTLVIKALPPLSSEYYPAFDFQDRSTFTFVALQLTRLSSYYQIKSVLGFCHSDR